MMALRQDEASRMASCSSRHEKQILESDLMTLVVCIIISQLTDGVALLPCAYCRLCIHTKQKKLFSN